MRPLDLTDSNSHLIGTALDLANNLDRMLVHDTSFGDNARNLVLKCAILEFCLTRTLCGRWVLICSIGFVPTLVLGHMPKISILAVKN